MFSFGAFGQEHTVDHAMGPLWVDPRIHLKTHHSGGHCPAGWRDDPLGVYESRYWDGSQWTEHVATGESQTTHWPTDPLPEHQEPHWHQKRGYWYCSECDSEFNSVLIDQICPDCNVRMEIAYLDWTAAMKLGRAK